ncbi:MAG: DegT/DnrJ/EryC1/StrS family aminotransferase [Bacteroidetes bacterium]|nr:MAG: DegT/DnrJ/EryC1/StrS family aminotransferase [Bacteroidota bacterium]
MKVPLLDLKLQYQSIKNEVEPAMLKVAESQMLILGEEVDKLEKTIASYLKTDFAVAVSSGTDSLLMALMAIDLKPGDEVIIPTYSFFATAGVVARLGAIPIFVDSEPVTMNIDTNQIKEKVNSKTKAIIPVHLYGQCAEMDELLKISNEYKIPIIEDCAQAIGAQYKDGRFAGSFGLMGCFSFYPTKNLGAFGEGGIITTNNKELADKLKQMRNHGMNPKYYHKFIGGNFRLDALQAAVLNVKFPHLEIWHQRRRENAQLYSELFIKAGLSESEGKINFDDKNKVLLPKAVYQNSDCKNYHIYNQYIIRVHERDKLREFLGKNDIGTEIYYPVPFHRQECFAYLNNNDHDFPIANELSETSIALPIFPELTKEQIQYVVEKIKEFLSR